MRRLRQTVFCSAVCLAFFVAFAALPVIAQRRTRPPQKPNPAPQPQAPDPNTGPFTPPPGTKIEPVTLAPVQQGVPFYVSPHGLHLAVTTMRGSRQVVAYDGVMGPNFDELFSQGGGQSIRFSPDGGHYAYYGRTGTEWSVMYDGKEIVRSSASVNGTIGYAQCALGFTANSQHLWFTSMEGNTVRFYFDGKPGPLGASADPHSYAFSPDGNHFAYIINDSSPPSPRTALIIDGQPAPYLAFWPQWSADSQHLFTKKSFPAQGHNVEEALYDGKAFMRADGITLYIPPLGNMVMAKVTKFGSPQSSYFLVVANKALAGSETTGQIGNIIFSPDGKDFAALYTMRNNRLWIYSDGKKGQEYLGFYQRNHNGATVPAQFTADSSKLVYETGTGSPYSEFLVINGQESEKLMPGGDLELDPVGNHVATIGGGQVTFDGKLLSYPGINVTTTSASLLSFSPDGSHYAFRLGWNMYLDGALQPNFAPTNLGALGAVKNNVTNNTYVWSPDGKHIAYFCKSSNPAAGDDFYLCVDNKAVRLGAPANLVNLMFSSDSNHLFGARNMGANKYRVFVDGKPIVEGWSAGISLGPESWEAEPDGSLAVLLQNETSINRVKITPSPSTNLATLLAGAVPNAK